VGTGASHPRLKLGGEAHHLPSPAVSATHSQGYMAWVQASQGCSERPQPQANICTLWMHVTHTQVPMSHIPVVRTCSSRILSSTLPLMVMRVTCTVRVWPARRQQAVRTHACCQAYCDTNIPCSSSSQPCCSVVPQWHCTSSQVRSASAFRPVRLPMIALVTVTNTLTFGDCQPRLVGVQSPTSQLPSNTHRCGVLCQWPAPPQSGSTTGPAGPRGWRPSG
jgi:hypothetical protein